MPRTRRSERQGSRRRGHLGLPNRMSTRKFGVEIEAGGLGTARAAQAIQGAGLSCVDYGGVHFTSPTPGTWQSTSDSSLHLRLPFEMKAPPLRGLEGMRDLRKALRALRAAGGVVNSDCGLHVHVDAPDFRGAEGLRRLKHLVKLWIRVERAVNCLLPPSRRGYSQYCQDTQANAMGLIACDARIDRAGSVYDLAMRSIFSAERFNKLNITPLDRLGTVEFRCHQGSLNAIKVARWVEFCLAVVDRAALMRAEDLRHDDEFDSVPMMLARILGPGAEAGAGAAEGTAAGAEGAAAGAAGGNGTHIEPMPIRRPREGTMAARLWERFDTHPERSAPEWYHLCSEFGIRREAVRARHNEWRWARQGRVIVASGTRGGYLERLRSHMMDRARHYGVTGWETPRADYRSRAERERLEREQQAQPAQQATMA